MTGVLDVAPVAEYWSIKRHDTAHDEFLHTREGRQFSHRAIGILSPCDCRLCRTISLCSPTAIHFQLLRDSCMELGARPCGLPCYAVSLDRSDTLHSLDAGQIIAETEPEKRRVVDVRHIRPTKQVGDAFIPTDVGDPLLVQLARFHRPVEVNQMKGWWRDHVVHFVGVESLILAGESYRPYKGTGSFVSDPSVTIFTPSILNMSSVYANVVWSIESIPSFSATGRQHEGYTEQKRKRPVTGLIVKALSSPVSEIVVPSLAWKRVCLDTYDTPKRPCSCKIVGDDPIDCDQHMMVRVVGTLARPARKKMRRRGEYFFSPGFFSRNGEIGSSCREEMRSIVSCYVLVLLCGLLFSPRLTLLGSSTAAGYGNLVPVAV